jgi:hypothetical protein
MANKGIQELILTQSFGCEVELINLTRKRAAEVVQEVVGGTIAHEGGMLDAWAVTATDGRIWRLVQDGSLVDAPYDLRCEVVTPILTYEQDIEILQSIVRALRTAGAKRSAWSSLHTHVSVEPHTPKTIRNLVKIFNRLEKLIYLACGTRKERLERYSKPNAEDFVRRLDAMRNPTERSLNRTWFNGHYNPRPHRYLMERYHSLNLCPMYREEGRQTVEFRMGEVPEGLHAGKIRAQIVLCLALSAAALQGRSCTSRRKQYDENAKYALRVGLVRLGLNGEMWRAVRKHLLANVPGNSAWKNPEAAKARRAEKDKAEATKEQPKEQGE